MISVLLDENMYYTGKFSTIGEMDGSIYVEALPDIYADLNKQKCYKYNSDTCEWLFDEYKYNKAMEEVNNSYLNKIKELKIEESKKRLSDYLDNATIVSSCHAGKKGKYSVKNEKQQNLVAMILTATICAQTGTDYQLSWNETGKPCSYDWTLEELQQLLIEIKAFINPLVMKQQTIEEQIINAKTEDEIKSIEISYE